MDGEMPERWTDEQSALFVRLFKLMCESPSIFMGDAEIEEGQWETVAWNAAWAAAEIAGSDDPIMFRDDEGEVLAAEQIGTLQ